MKVQLLPSTLPGCVTMSKSPDLSEPHFSRGKMLMSSTSFPAVPQIKGDMEIALLTVKHFTACPRICFIVNMPRALDLREASGVPG